MRQFLFAPRQWVVVLCGAAAVLLSAAAYADPPGRVARLTQIEGTISFSPAGEDDWAIAEANRPVTTGDRVWSDANSHVELQIGDASTRLGANTALTVLNLDDRIGQFQLAQGTLNVRVKRVSGDQFYEIDTPTLAFSIRQAGDYRVDVDPDGNTSVIQVRAGSGEAWGEGTAYTIDAGQQYTFTGEGIRDVRYDAIPAPDRFDQWCFDRNRREDAATAARYVSPEVVGYSDLDEYGTWRNVENYGTVWVPTRVQADWVPYHYGRWAWVEPWGWTWVDDQPWGFAPFHYGRWAYLSSRWCWVPGPVVARPVYAPALVAFVGGNGFSVAVGGGSGVGWFPLGVGEVYRPSYEVSRTYFTNVNVTNTVVNTTYVTNVYNNQNVEINYRNRQVAGAVTAVPVNAFASGERVDRHAVRVQSDAVARAEVAPAPRIAPTRAAVLATAAATGTAVAVAAHRPPERVLSRQVVARTEPPPPRASFAARERLLAEQPGRPLDQERMRSVRAERPAEAPKVKVVTPNVQPRPVEAAKGGPRGTPQGAPTAQEERAMKDRRGQPEAAGPQANAPQPPANAQERMRGGPQGGPQGPTAQEERGMKDRRGRPEAAGPQANAPQPPASAQERMRGGPQGGPQGPTAQEERGMKDRRGRPEAPAPQANAPQPPASAQDRFRGGPQGAPQGPTAQEERGMKDRRGRPEAPGPQANAPQPPTTAQERMKGGPQGAQAAQERAQQERAQQQGRAQQDRTQQERVQQERAQQERARQQQERGQQERSQAERSQQQAQQPRAQQQEQQRAQQERGQAQAQQQRAQQERAQQQAQQQRAQQERAQAQAQQQRGQQERAQQQAQQQRAQQERAQAQAQQQQRAQQERGQAQAQQQRAQQQTAEQQRAQQQAQQQRAPQEQRREEPKGRGQAQQEKDKDKEPRG